MKRLKEYNFSGTRNSEFSKFKMMRILNYTSIYEYIKIDGKYNNYKSKLERGEFGKR